MPINELDQKIKNEELFEAYDIAKDILDDAPVKETLYKLAVICSRIGKIDEATSYLASYIYMGGTESFAHLNLGHMYKAKRDFSKAAEEYKAFIKTNNTFSGHGWWHLSDLKDFTPTESELNALKSERSQSPTGSTERLLMDFALGTYMDRLNKKEEAYQYFKAANNAFSELKPFNLTAFYRLIEDLETLKELPKLNLKKTTTPIFIVGMPRSGSTLCEQILSSHSKIIATDELPFINSMATKLERTGSYSQALQNISLETAVQMREEYLKYSSHYRGNLTLHFVDKSPINFIHIGLIKTIFPDAKIISTQRKATDNALSIYKRFFFSGNEYAYKFSDIFHYMSGYNRLMNHWTKLIPDEIFICSYEQLVHTPKESIASLLKFCEVEPEQSCFEHHKHTRDVFTPSADQVSKPIYRDAVDSWKQYEDQIPELDIFRLSLIDIQQDILFNNKPSLSNSWSEYWEQGNTTSFLTSMNENYDGALKEYWLSSLKDQKDPLTILDVCTGNGAIPALIAEHYPETPHQITGIDSAKILSKSVGNIRLLSGTNVENLPFEDETFDLITSQYGIEYAKLDIAFKQSYRTLKRGGQIRAICHTKDSTIYLQNSLIYGCTNEIIHNCIPCFSEMLKGLDLKHRQDNSYDSIANHHRNKFNGAIASIQEKYGDILFKTGFPAAMKYLLSLKNQGNTLSHLSQYKAHLVSAQLRLMDLLEAAISDEDAESLKPLLTRIGFKAVKYEKLFQDDKVIGLAIEAKK